jgi:hypothetical protein
VLRIATFHHDKVANDIMTFTLSMCRRERLRAMQFRCLSKLLVRANSKRGSLPESTLSILPKSLLSSLAKLRFDENRLKDEDPFNDEDPFKDEELPAIVELTLENYRRVILDRSKDVVIHYYDSEVPRTTNIN